MLLVVFGYGTGVSHATAVRFGAEGYAVALVGRTPHRLDDGVARLADLGIAARAYACDVGQPGQVRDVVDRIRAQQGPVSTLLWTAYGARDVGDVLETLPEQVAGSFAVGVTGLLTAVQQSLRDLREAPGSAVLVANGALGDATSAADRMAVTYGIDGAALEYAAKSKLVGLLAERLRDDGVYVGEVVVEGRIKGTERSRPEAGTAIDPAEVARMFWDMAQAREVTRRRVVEPST